MTRRWRTTWSAAVLLLVLSPLAGVLAPSPAAAQERILSYVSEVEVLENADLEVTEHITVFAEGREIRRGIYRDFPTRYRDRYGNRVRVDLEVLGVERNGQPEAWFTERVRNGVRINTGGDAFLPVPAEHTFTIRYRTTRQLGFFEEHDELYWNAIGTGWSFPIEAGSVEVRLPEPVVPERMGVEGYTGPQGAQGDAYAVDIPAPGVARYALTAPLAPGEGFTVVLTFPKGVVVEPTRADRAQWFLADNAGVLVGLAGLASLLFFCVVRWRKVGRDPDPGVIVPRYTPRAGQTPAAARYLRRMGYDDRCFSSDVLDLAVGGHLRIHRDEEGRKKEWRLERTAPGPSSASRPPREPAPSGARTAARAPTPTRDPAPAQHALLHTLFGGRSPVIELDQANATTLRAARSAHRQVLDNELHGRYFRRNGRSTFLAYAITAGTALLAFLLSGGNGLPFIVAIVFVMLGSSTLFGHFVRAPTPEGRTLLDELEGLRLYMGVAERDELAEMAGPGGPPPLDPERYEALLPFAVALDVEEAWTEKLTAAVGTAVAAEAAHGMRWYVGPGAVGDLGSFSRSLGSGLSGQIASASTPPGSSSGFGGGGSSGGGGGGGGGGGR